MQFDYNHQVNTRLKVAGIDYFELGVVVFGAVSLATIGLIVGTVVPGLRNPIVYCAILLVFPFVYILKQINKSSEKSFLFSFIGFLTAKSRKVDSVIGKLPILERRNNQK